MSHLLKKVEKEYEYTTEKKDDNKIQNKKDN